MPKLMHPSWELRLNHLLKDERMKRINEFLFKNPDFTPKPAERIFAAFRIPIDRVKVIILGQNPYPTNEATGVSFAVDEKPYKDYPFSLKVIADSLTDEPDSFFVSDLSTWEAQGVLMLNTALTTKLGESKNVHGTMWKWFIEGVLKVLNDYDNSLILYTLGNDAKAFAPLFDLERHYHFHSVHPAALYHNPGRKFDSHFEEISNLYERLYGQKLYWVLPF